MTLEKDLLRYEQAKKRKSQFDLLYEDAIRYSAPHRDSHLEYTEGASKNNADVVFDSTAMIAMQKFASNLQSSLCPPMKKWINLKGGYMVDEQNKEQVAKDLQKVRDVMFNFLHSSNFDTQVSESFLDLAVGTGALLLQKGTKGKPFRFVSVPISQICLEEAADGRVGAIFRTNKVAARSIKDVWPNAKLDKEFNEWAKEQGDKKIEFAEMLIPEKITVDVEDGNGVKRKTKVDGFRYSVVAEKKKKRILNEATQSNPWIVFRWSVMPGEVMGRGPVTFSLPDIKTLNKTKELTLKNASMAIAGAWTVRDDGVVNVNTVQIYPGAKIPVESNDGGVYGASIKRLEAAGNFDVSNLIIQDLRRTINEMMFAEPLGPIDLPVKSATEVSLRQQELSKRIGSAFGRLQYEFIGPLINRMLHILEEFGHIDVQNFRADGGVINIQHTSPLAMAQDEEELISVFRYSEFIVQQYGPEVAAILLPPEKVLGPVGELLNVPEDIKPTKQQLQQIAQMARGALTAQAQAAQTQQDAPQGA